jgi:hypothetical protein
MKYILQVTASGKTSRVYCDDWNVSDNGLMTAFDSQRNVVFVASGSYMFYVVKV